MRRYVYSPKVYAYVNTGGAIGNKHNPPNVVDLTAYITAGSVNRVINAVSTAQITIRNPRKKWTQPGKPTFRPMDPITIFMTREKGFPVQVFTGYLDRTPYYAMYPGTVTLTASCTLKRLLHTYFDPALPYTFAFLAKHGWVPSGGGSVINMPEETKSGKIGDPKGVYVIGDSLAQGTSQDLRNALDGYKVETNAQTGRSTAAGIAALKAEKGLPSTVVVSLGTNDNPSDTTGFRNRIRELMDVVGSRRHVIWVNFRGTGQAGDLSPLNAVLTREAQQHPNLTVVNWNKQVSDQNIDMTGVHTNAEGYKKRAKAIATSVRNGGGSVGSANEEEHHILEDSGFGKLLYHTLIEIGGWKDNQIYIEKLPDNIAEKVTNIFRDFASEDDQALKDHANFLHKLIGVGSEGSGGGDESSSVALGSGPAGKQIFDYFVKRGFTDEQAAGWVGNFFQESGLNPARHQQGGGPGRGLAQWEVGARFEDLKAFANKRGKPWTDMQTQLDFVWYELQGTENKAYKLIKATKTVEQAADAIVTWYERAGKPGNRHGPAREAFKRYAGKTESSDVDEGAALEGNSSSGTGNRNMGGGGGTQVEDAGGGDQGSSSDQIDISGGAKTIVDSAVAIAQQFGSNVYVASDYREGDPLDHGSNDGTKAARDIAVRGVDALTGPPHPNLDKAIVAIGKALGRNYESGTSGPFQNADNIQFEGFRVQLIWRTSAWGGHMGHIHIGARKGPGGTPGDGGNPGSGGGTSTDEGDVGTQANAAAFAAVLNWPSLEEQMESVFLQGRRSLMNDKPLFPFIEQMTGAALRQFQSLPNGVFFAFYPDYFGEMGHRKPYWEIDDVEILDGNIELNDDNLVTHQFVVGDTHYGGGIILFERLRSGGIVSVFNAFGSVENLTPLVPEFDGKEGNEAAISFLRKYGARPDYHPAPMIRSPYFEAFLAYQRFMLAWSRQFATNFTFTFMPELYPGGRVGFPTHGLQCYIESVTHNWDYSSGFTTTAVLSAPSAYGSNALNYSTGLVRDTSYASPANTQHRPR